MIRVLHGDCREILPTLGEPFHACVCDPPYGLEFMGVAWDTFSNGPKGRSRPKNEWGDFGSREHARQASEVARINRNKNRVFEEFSYEWACKVFDALLPGAYLVAFGGTRTYHRMVCAIEDAGFEIRDTLCWLYGTGFPKSLDVSKAIDKAAGAERGVIATRELTGKARVLKGGNYDGAYDGKELTTSYNITAPATPEAAAWQGWGTALKPAFEPIILARKPLIGTVAANVLAHGTGALHVDACRVAASDKTPAPVGQYGGSAIGPTGHNGLRDGSSDALGRWPANVLHSGDEQVEAAFAAFGERATAQRKGYTNDRDAAVYGKYANSPTNLDNTYSDTGTASRFFQRCAFSPDELRFHYSSKADTADRADSSHPTVKPVALLRWLVRLVSPPGGHILDPFAGSGTTGEAAMLEGFDCTLIEQDAQHVADIQHRIKRWSGGDTPLFKEAAE